jgi:uncharacterized protein (DUF983 family)
MRGLQRKCPCCGQGKAFRGYLKVAEECTHCRTPLGIYPCDDGPAYLTMLLIGHVVIGPAFMLNVFYIYPAEIIVPSMLAAMLALTLATLPVVKGFYLNLMWYLGLKRAR